MSGPDQQAEDEPVVAQEKQHVEEIVDQSHAVCGDLIIGIVETLSDENGPRARVPTPLPAPN